MSENTGPGRDPGYEPPYDELRAAKEKLLNIDAQTAERASAFVRKHPYLSAAAALGAGLAVGKVTVLRKAALGMAMWAGKQAAMNYMRKP